MPSEISPLAIGSALKLKSRDMVFFSGITSKKIKYGGDPIDVTDDDSLEARELLDNVNVRYIEIPCSGIAKSTIFQQRVINGDSFERGVYVEFYDGQTIACDWLIQDLNEEHASSEISTYSFTLLSSGKIYINVTGGFGYDFGQNFGGT